MGIAKKPAHQVFTIALFIEHNGARAAGVHSQHVFNERSTLGFGQLAQALLAVQHGLAFKLQQSVGCTELFCADLYQTQLKAMVLCGGGQSSA